MKKIFILLSLFMFIFIIEVKAETFYSDYYKVETIDGLKEDEVSVETFKLYNTYKIEYEDLGYIEENNKFIKDEKDYILKDIETDSSSGDEYININLNHIDQFKTGIKFNIVTTNTKFSEIEIYNNDEKLMYETTDLHDISNLYDNNLDTYYEHQNTLQNIRFGFFNRCNLEEIKFVIYTKANSINTKFFLYTDPRIYINLDNSVDRKHIITFKIDDSNVSKVDYSYIDKIKLFRHYKKNEIVLNEFVIGGENIILDDYKIENVYYKRDKIILNDELIINNRNIKVEDFIEYSNGEVTIDCNLDYYTNGIYKCNFNLNDLNIEKNIVVDINENVEFNKEIIIDNISKEIENIAVQNISVDNELKDNKNIVAYNINDDVSKNFVRKYNAYSKLNVNKKQKEDFTDKHNDREKYTNKPEEKILLNNKKNKNKLKLYFEIIFFIIIILLGIIKIIRIYCRKGLKNKKYNLY